MNFISAENISRSYGDKQLFKGLNIGIGQGERVGLIGINGSGKSSLLKILGGLEPPDSGTVSVRKGVRVGFLGQNPVFDESKSVFDNVFYSGNTQLALIKEYENHLNADRDQKGYDDKLHELIERMNDENAWNYEQQINEIISKLGILEYIEKPVRLLSGGQRKRVAMAKLLIEEPDILILDEPTNHLDLDTIEWLEELIHNQFQTLFLVTHDRYFLDKVCNHVIELDRGELYKYKGNYGYFLEKKAEREQILNSEIDKAKNLMRKELDWIRRQPKARGTKAKYRVDAFEDTKAKATQNRSEAKLELQVKTTRQGGKILELKKVGKAYDNKTLIKDFTYTFKKGDKIGVIGKNGAGKSTFLNMLIGEVLPDKGDIVKGETTAFGFYKQEEAALDPEKRLIEEVKDIAEFIEMANGQKVSASQFLNLFMFPPAVQYTYISKLSGGEKKRLQLLKILIKNPNFLILDEPTNDLDIGTLNILEDFLQEFQGTLIIVSHDRYFMDRLVDHLFVFEGEGEISDFPGNYTQWREDVKERKLEVKNQKSDGGSEKLEIKSEKLNVETKATEMNMAVEPKRKLSFKEKTEYETLEKNIEKLEAEKEKLTTEMNSGELHHEKLIEYAVRIEKITNELEENSIRWLELGEHV